MKISLSIILLVLASCSTVKETLDPLDSSQDYTRIMEKSGETVYKRKKIIRKTKANFQVSKFDKKKAINNISPNIPSTLAVTEESSSSKTNVLLEMSFGGGHSHIGVGLNTELGNNFDLKGGISLFTSKRIIYTGFDLVTRFKIKVHKSFTPFIGVGGYAGDTKSCTTETDDFETFELCEKKFLFATYTELGLRFNRVSLFARQYYITDANISLPVKSLLGFNFFF